jgi:putative spermidine/putrescine transport system permease protein
MLIVLGDYFSRLSASAYERVSDSLILAVLIFPQVIYGLALRHVLGISSVPGIVLLTLGNVVLLMPVQYMVLQAAYGHLLNSQLHAATVLGASVLAGITRVYLPLMWRPVVAAWCIGAVIAFDELVIAMFLWDGTVEPVSKRLWQLFGRSADPIPGAITLIVVFLIVIVIAFALLLRAYLTRSARHQT